MEMSSQCVSPFGLFVGPVGLRNLVAVIFLMPLESRIVETEILIFFSDLGVCAEPGGVVNVIRSGALFPYQVGDVVAYTCNNGFSGSRVCLEDESWSGNVTCSG